MLRNKWYSVYKKLPEQHEEVLIQTFDNKYVIGKYENGNKLFPWVVYGYNSLFCNCCRMSEIKAWMYIPKRKGK